MSFPNVRGRGRLRSIPRRQHPPSASFFENWGLTIVLFSLFAICITGQALSGWVSYNQTQVQYHDSQVSLEDYAATGTFLNGVFSNLQAALLQLAVLIIFTRFLYQRGAAHSRRPPRKGQTGGDDEARVTDGSRSGHFRRGIYEHSLSLAFVGGFLLALAGHVVYGSEQYNLQLAQNGQPQVTVAQYTESAAFWFSNFQVWQAEFLAIALLTILTVYLRERGSAESKPVNSTSRKTGVGD